jgi:GR25 family glycosyltransferase involved in LPS biosynthesis
MEQSSLMSSKLHLYVIHTQHLTVRQGHLHGVIQTIRQTAQGLGMEFQSTLILKPDPEHLVPNLQTLNTRVSYETVNDSTYDSLKHVLNIEEISNLEKHREAWRRIQDESEGYYMIIEDDNLLPPENVPYFATLLSQPTDTWDFLDLNMSTQTEQLTLNPIYQHTKVLASKQAYLLSRNAARVFLRETETIRFSARVHLSHAIFKYKDGELKKSYFPSKRIMLEGSKVGIFPSTIHGSNLPVYNAEFMQLWNILRDDSKPMDESVVRSIYKNVEHTASSDLCYVYGLLLKKLGKYKEAHDVWEKGMEHHIKNQGMLNQQTDLLQELIKIYEYLQTDEVREYMKTPSKYAIKVGGENEK